MEGSQLARASGCQVSCCSRLFVQLLVVAADVARIGERFIERLEDVLVPLQASLIAEDNPHDYARLAPAATGLDVNRGFRRGRRR